MTLRLICFNTQGFRRLEKENELVQLALSTRFNLLFLQETNFSSPRDMEEFMTLFSLEAFFLFAATRFSVVVVIVINRALLQTFS